MVELFVLRYNLINVDKKETYEVVCSISCKSNLNVPIKCHANLL